METGLVRRRIVTPMLPWALSGLALGVAAGFVLGELFGTGGHRRIGRLIRPHKGRAHLLRARVAGIARVTEALAADPLLRQHAIEVRSRGARGLELRGWVASRNARALAHRIARAAAVELDVANRLLVRGEDDRFEHPVREDVPRPA